MTSKSFSPDVCAWYLLVWYFLLIVDLLLGGIIRPLAPLVRGSRENAIIPLQLLRESQLRYTHAELSLMRVEVREVEADDRDQVRVTADISSFNTPSPTGCFQGHAWNPVGWVLSNGDWPWK